MNSEYYLLLISLAFLIYYQWSNFIKHRDFIVQIRYGNALFGLNVLLLSILLALIGLRKISGMVLLLLTPLIISSLYFNFMY